MEAASSSGMFTSKIISASSLLLVLVSDRELRLDKREDEKDDSSDSER